MGNAKNKSQEPVVTHSVVRKAISEASAPVLLRIHTFPKFLVPALIAGLMVLALFLTGVAAGICLSIVAIFIGWLMYLSWPLLDARSRIVRLLVLGILIAATAVKFVS